jgi:hypothetical protein
VSKCCAACGRDDVAFGKNATRSDGLDTYCRECARRLSRLQSLAARYDVLVHYCNGDTPKCACCGETRLEFLALDHINGGGSRHAKEINFKLARWLKSQGYPDGYRVLCHNCNFALGHYGYCPHEAGEKLQADCDYYKARLHRGRGGNRCSKLTVQQVRDIKRRLAVGERYGSVAVDFGVNPTTVARIHRGESWRGVSLEDEEGCD